MLQSGSISQKLFWTKPTDQQPISILTKKSMLTMNKGDQRQSWHALSHTVVLSLDQIIFKLSQLSNLSNSRLSPFALLYKYFVSMRVGNKHTVKRAAFTRFFAEE